MRLWENPKRTDHLVLITHQPSKNYTLFYIQTGMAEMSVTADDEPLFDQSRIVISLSLNSVF